MNSALRIVDYIFPALQLIISLVALTGAIFNIVRFFKLLGKPKAFLHLACGIGMLLLGIFLIVWLYKAYLVGFHY